jgi:hypothetical protein
VGSLSGDRHAEIGREFELWKTAERNRDAHFVRLWELCDREIKHNLKVIARKEGVSWRMWLKRRGLGFDDVRQHAFFAVWEAARGFDPEHDSGASFATYAFKYIKGEVAKLAECSPHLAGAHDAEALEQEEVHELLREDEPPAFIELVRAQPASETAEQVYQGSKDASAWPSQELRRMAKWLAKVYADELKHDAKLQALHSMLIAQSARAEDHEGKMVLISTLAKLLRIREARRAASMPAESYSANVLAEVYDRPSPPTLRKWFEACDEQGVTTDNWTPEQLARIISSKRGPSFRGRLNQ